MIAHVSHVIHVKVPVEYRPQLFITDVPKGLSIADLKEVLDGKYWFGEFSIKWANHEVGIGLRDAHADIKRAYRSKEVETVSYDDLVDDSDLPD